MKRIIALVGLATFSSFFWGVGVEPVNGQASCQATVDAVAREIKKKGTTVRVDVLPGGNDHGPHLDNMTRIGSISFAMAGTGRPNREDSVAWNIVNSRILMKSYANRIFSRCGGTGYVSFWVANTGIYEGFGMTDGGTLAVEECSDNPRQIANRVSSVSGPGPSGYCAYVIPDF
jgi:hypothetical protein